MTIAINHHTQTSPNASPRSFNDSTHTGGASSGALQEHTAKALFAQMVAGMQHCHNLGVGHRDMSLENIMYSKPKADAPKAAYWCARHVFYILRLTSNT